MALTADILESWRRPRTVVRRLLDQTPSEPFAFSLILVFLVLVIVSNLPALARESALAGGEPLSPRVLATALGAFAALPVCYLLAALGTLISGALGNRVSHYAGRIALFWAALAATPAMLALGVLRGLAGPGGVTVVLGLAVGLAFLAFWVMGLREAGRADGRA